MTATMTQPVGMPAANGSPDNAAAPQRDGLSDEALAEQTQAGCVKSYEALDRRYRVRLIHLLRRRVGRESDAEDLAQVALWTAYHKIDQYDPKRKFSTWLFTIAVRKAIDHARTNARHVAPEGHEPTVGGDAILALPGQDAGPLERAIAEEEHTRRRDVIWAIAEQVLNPAQWTALWLHYGQAQSPAEVARAMGISRVNARVLLHRARKVLARRLENAPHDLSNI